MVRTSLVALVLTAAAVAQPPAPRDAFAFDPAGKPLAPQPPGWWNLAVSPDGRTIVTAHARERGAEWRAWDTATGKVVATVGEPGGTRFVAYSPDGTLVATANFDGAVRLYDARTRTLLAEGKGHTAGVNALSFNGDGTMLASAGLDKTARLWDVAAGRPRAGAFVPRAIFEGLDQAVYAVGLSPDGTKLATGGPDGKVRLWDVPKLDPGKTARVTKERLVAADHKTTIECLAFAPDGKRFASGSWDNTAKLFDADGTEIATLRGHNRGVMALAFSPTSKALVTVSGDHASNVGGEIRLWAAADGADLGLIGREPDMAVGVGFGPAGATVATCGRDHAVHLWDVATRKQTHEFRLPSDAAGPARAVHALAYSPDGKLLAVAGEAGVIDVWDVRARQVVGSLTGHTDVVASLAWVKDGQLVTASPDRTARVWDVATAKVLHTLKHPAPVYAVAVTPDGKTIATGGFDTVVRLWRADTGAETGKLEGHTASVRCLAYDGAGVQLASAGSDFCIRVWVPGEKSPRELRGHSRTVRAVAFKHPGFLVSAGDDGLVHEWNVPDNRPGETFGPFADGVLSVAVAPGKSFVAVGLGNGRVHLMDTLAGVTRGVLTGPTDRVSAVAVAPDGRQIAAGGLDKVVRVWSPANDPDPAAVTFVGHQGEVLATAVSPDGKRVATGGADGTIRLSNAVTGAVEKTWKAHDGAVGDLAYAADGTALISGSRDRTAKVWRADGTAVKTLAGASVAVHRVALSKAGTLAATADVGRGVRVYDLTANSEKTLEVDTPPVALQFLPDDTLLSAGGPRAYLWDVGDGRVLETLDKGQFAKITAAAAGADGKLVVLAGDPAAGTFLTADAGNGRVMAVSRHHAGSTPTMRMNDTGVSAVRVAVAADGRMIVAVGGDGTARVWEWPDAKLVRKFPAHAAPAHGLAVSARGEFAVTASADGTARRWPASKGEPLVYAAKLTDESKQTWFARRSPDGKVLITGGDDGVVRLRRGTPGASRPLAGEFPAAFSAVPSPDGSVLATGHLDGTIRIWDAKTGQKMHKLDRHGYRVWALAFSPDGTRLVSGGGNWDEVTPGEVRVWDTSNWKLLHEASAHLDLVFAAAVSADSKTFATGSKDGSITLWDLSTFAPGLTVRGGGTVRGLTFAKDGRLFSCGSNHKLQWWDVKAGKSLGTGTVRGGEVERMAPTPDGKHLVLAIKVAGTQYVPALWDVEKNDLVREFAGRHESQINAVAVSPDGKTVVTGGGVYAPTAIFRPGPVGPYVANTTFARDGSFVTTQVPTCELKCWDLETGRPLAELPGTKFWAETAVFTADGSGLLTGGGVVDQPGELRVWETAALRPAAVVKASGPLTCGLFSPDGTHFITGSTNGGVTLWTVADALDGKEAGKALGQHAGMVRGVAWSRDGKRLASAGEDGVVRVWAAPFDGKPLAIPAHDRPVYGIAFSPDGTRVATAAGDYKNRKAGEVRVWDTTAGTEVYRLPDAAESVWAVAFAGGDQLVTAQGGPAAVKVWDVKSRKELKALTAAQAARGLGLSPDGQWLGLTGGTDGLIKVWEAGPWREAYEVIGHPGKVVFGLDFGADGQTVVSAGGDAAVVWKVPGGEWKVPEFVPPPPPALRPARRIKP